MPPTADVIVIGAGVIGCSTAYHLAKAGVTDVLVVEMDQVGAGSSGQSASMLSLQFCTSELSARMAQYSYGRYMAFEEEIGVPIDFKRTGWVSLATKESAEQLLEVARIRRHSPRRRSNIDTQRSTPTTSPWAPGGRTTGLSTRT